MNQRAKKGKKGGEKRGGVKKNGEQKKGRSGAEKRGPGRKTIMVRGDPKKDNKFKKKKKVRKRGGGEGRTVPALRETSEAHYILGGKGSQRELIIVGKECNSNTHGGEPLWRGGRCPKENEN